MSDYISSLSGQEMDAALTDMAQHDSEAWAVGTRNGVDVTSGDETYDNNSKYWAEQAASVIQGTVTQAVRWDTAQSLNSTAKAQARTNIGAINTTEAETAAETVVNTAINRTTAVNVADTNYTTYMARGASLNDSATTPTVNGTIAWVYE